MRRGTTLDGVSEVPAVNKKILKRDRRSRHKTELKFTVIISWADMPILSNGRNQPPTQAGR